MIEHDAFAHDASGMNVHAEHFRVPALDEKRQFLAPALPQEVREAVYLDGLETLQVQNHRQVGVDRRVALEDGQDVAGCTVDDLDGGAIRFFEEFPHGHHRHDVVGKLVGQNEGQRGLQILVVEHAGIDVTGQQRLFSNDFLRFGAELAPEFAGHGMPLAESGKAANYKNWRRGFNAAWPGFGRIVVPFVNAGMNLEPRIEQ